MSNQDQLRTELRSLPRPVRAVSFWAGVTLPLLYLPLLAAGPVSGMRAAVLVSFIVLHAVALTVGHAYRADGE